MIELYGCKLLDEIRFLEVRHLILSHLPAQSREEAARYRNVPDEQRKVLGELLVRAIIGKKLRLGTDKIEFTFSEKKKPLLLGHDALHFNISHSGDWVVAAFSEKPVGVDVEKIRKMNFGVAQRFFSPEEVAALLALPEKKQIEYFFELWTLKESYLKALGTGLTRPLNSFSIVRDKKGHTLMENNEQVEVFLRQIRLDRNHKLAVCGYEPEIGNRLTPLFIDDLVSMFEF